MSYHLICPVMQPHYGLIRHTAYAQLTTRFLGDVQEGLRSLVDGGTVQAPLLMDSGMARARTDPHEAAQGYVGSRSVTKKGGYSSLLETYIPILKHKAWCLESSLNHIAMHIAPKERHAVS